MKLINSEIEQEIASEEANSTNILNGRKILEKALICQFRVLADGLFAHLLLQNSPDISKMKWWYHYLSKLDHVPSKSFPDFEGLEFSAFCTRFAQEVANGQITPITPADLNKIQIRIFGGYFYLWDDVRINRQLTNLGSSLRFVCVGSRNVALNYIKSILGRETDQFKVDGRFIFGSVGPVTAIPLAPLFDFEREYAVSPYLADWGGGFNYEKRIVIRQLIIKIATEEWVDKTPDRLNIIAFKDESDSNKSLTAKEYFANQGYEKVFRTRWLLALLHEEGHGTPEFGYAYLKTFWRDDIKNDICRYTQSPRSAQEIREAMQLGFSYPQKDLMEEYSDELPPAKVLPTLDTILGEMKVEGALEQKDGKLQCQKYRNAKLWTQ